VSGSGGAVGELTQDEGPRAETSVERLAALVVASSTAVHEHGLKPWVASWQSPARVSRRRLCVSAPVPATQKALEKAERSHEDLDTVELNQVFASQSIARICDVRLELEIVNAHGGAIALGH
jgi:acetyl-CoA acetyltransferase